MKTLSAKLVEFGGEPAHWCPGCEELHRFCVTKPSPHNGAQWTFDGNLDAPTFFPSMNIRAEFPPEDGGPDVCHYFLRGGMIEYLGDCTHALANTKMTLPDLPEWAKSRG